MTITGQIFISRLIIIPVKKYNLVIRVIIFLFAVLHVAVAAGAYLYVAEGSMAWTPLIPFSIILGVLDAYVASFPHHLDKRFNLQLTKLGSFLFVLFLVVLVFAFFMMAMPEPP